MKYFKIFRCYIYLIIVLSFTTAYSSEPAEQTHIERRAVFELGSGSMRLLVADYDVLQHRIVKTVHTEKVYVKLAKYLAGSNHNNTFSDQLMNLAVEKIQYLKNEAIKKGAVQFSGIATSSFRQASNGRDFVDKINDITRINLRMVSQQEEGLCAFYSVSDMSSHIQDLTGVLDIGGGSLQLTIKDKHKFTFITRELGAEFAKNSLLDIQGRNRKASVYPVSQTDFVALKERILLELNTVALSEQEKSALKNINSGLKVVGTCRNLVQTFLDGKSKLNKETIEKKVFEQLNQSTEMFNARYAEKLQERADTQFILSNAALLLALAEYLGIDTFTVLTVADNTAGILLQPAYWNEK